MHTTVLEEDKLATAQREVANSKADFIRNCQVASHALSAHSARGYVRKAIKALNKWEVAENIKNQLSREHLGRAG